MRNYILYGLGAAVILLLVRDINLIAGFPDERSQGAIFKIIFFHVPMAITAMLLSFVALVASVMFLKTKNFKYDAVAVAVTEVGLAFLRSEEHTSELQSPCNLVCRLLLEKK